MDNAVVNTTLATISLELEDSFFEKYTLAVLNVAGHIKETKQYETMGNALIAIKELEDGNFLHSFSAAWPGNGRIYLMHENTADKMVAAAITGMEVHYRKLYSASSVKMENLCDLILKYRLLDEMPRGNNFARKNGIYYKCSERLAMNIRFRSDPDHPGYAVIQAAGKNMKKTIRTDGKPFPFYFSPTGVMVYSEHTPEQRYVWKTRDDKYRTKIKVMEFATKEDYEETRSMLRCVNETVRLIGSMEGVALYPLEWEGRKYDIRIGENDEAYRSMDAAAARVAAEHGIAVRCGDGVPANVAAVVKQGFEILFAETYKGKAARLGGKDSRYSRIRIRDKSVLAVRAAKKTFYPEQEGDQLSFFLGSKNVSEINVSEITAYSVGSEKEEIEADLYDGNGLFAETVELKKTDEKKENPFALKTSSLTRDGEYVIEVIRGLDDDVPYSKDLHVQHIAAQTVTELQKSPEAMCRNLLYQLVIKRDLLSGNFTFLDVPELTGYEFIYSLKGCFVTMRMLDGRHFKITETSWQDRVTLCHLEGVNSEEALKRKEYYAVKTPSGQMFDIQDSGLTMMPALSFSAKDASRGGIKNNRILAPFLDYVIYDVDGCQYYSAGWNTKGIRPEYSYMPKIRRLATCEEGKLDMDVFFKTLNVPFVWMAQKNTVIPFPFKYLREYAALIIPPEKEDHAVSEDAGNKSRKKKRSTQAQGKEIPVVIEKDKEPEPRKHTEKKRTRITVTALQRPVIIAFAQVLDPEAYADGSAVFVAEEYTDAVKDFLAQL